jgi:glutamine synthetase
MPKPLFEDNGTGMHTHLSIWKDGEPTFAGDGYAGVSDTPCYAIGGILKHCPGPVRLYQPDYQLLQTPGAGIRSARQPGLLQPQPQCRRSGFPCTPASPKAKRIEFRTPDPSCNGYLAFSAMLMAALDGIENKIDPGDPLDKDIYGLPAEELA